MSVSIQEIASKVGVSKAAVSLALRDSPRISSSRRREIQKIAIGLGYEPNMLARGLTGGRTHTIGILWGLGGSHTPVQTAQSIAIKVQSRGYIASIGDIAYSEVTEKLLLDYAKRQVDGVVLQLYEPLEEPLISILRKFPAVVLVTTKTDPSGFDQIVQDRLSAFYEVAQYLRQSGRKRPLVLIAFSAKANACTQILKQSGIEVPYEGIIKSDEMPDSLDAFYAILDERVDVEAMKPDVIICNNDNEALATMRWIQSKGLKIPEDIAVIGFNNSETTTYMSTPLASIARNDEKVVDVVEQMLFARLNDTELPQQEKMIPMKFVWRESAGVKIA